ncbi:MAG: fused MFS/spermidine synthase [Proteobacteria bacterium]|nr:fused MFS/spermidine synthase [Pseudomonadota bacterium]
MKNPPLRALLAELLPYELEISEEAGVRSLHFGSKWIQGSMRIRRPYALELAYTREMMACLLLRPDTAWPSRALLIGLGAGSLAKYMYRHLPQTRITAVEIDARILPMARQQFALPEDPQRLKVVIADAADYIRQSGSKFDAIFVDGYGPDGLVAALDTLEFYSACRHRLSSQGLLISNLLSHSRGYAASAERIHVAFEQRSVVFPSLDSGNAVAFAACGETVDVTLKEMRAQALELRLQTGLDLRPTITRLQLVQSLPQGRLQL